MILATADGVSFASIGLGLKSHNIPVLPPTKDNTLELADRDGVIDFGSTYGARTFNLECIVMAEDSTIDYHNRVAQVAALLIFEKEISYSHLVIYRVNVMLLVMPELWIYKS